MYLFTEGSDSYSEWVDLAKETGFRDIYYAMTPARAFDKLIICRMDPAISENSFDTGEGNPLWNQTGNLTYVDSAPLYTLTGGTGNSATGE